MTSPTLYTPGGLPVPGLSKEPNVPLDMALLGEALDPLVELRFATVSERDGVYPATEAPLNARCLITGTGRRYLRWIDVGDAPRWFEFRDGAIVVADQAARLALPTGLMPPGFAVYETAAGRRWEWAGPTWVYLGRTLPTVMSAWNTATRASVNNYNLASITVNPGTGPYLLVARVSGAFTVPAGASGNLRLFISTNVDFLGSCDLTPSRQSGEAHKYLPITSGASVTVTANLEVLTGSITHYGDPRHSVVEAFAIPMGT